MFDSLRSLSDHQILASTDRIIAQDRRLTLQLLVHLHEVERRKLYLKRGYSSMFVYCTSHLRLSEPAAVRRIKTARCLARFPELRGLLESGEVNLSSISTVARVLTHDNAKAVLERIRGASRYEVEKVVAEFEPRAGLPPDRVRVVTIPVAVAGAPCSFSTAPRVSTDQEFTVAGDGKISSTAGPVRDMGEHPTAPQPVHIERRVLIQFSAGEEFLAVVEKIRSLASHRLPRNATFEHVFALVMDDFVKREDPAARHERREARKASVGPVKGESTPEPAQSRPRQIAAHTRDQVFMRDKGRCTYVASSGRRCDSEYLLQVDHIRPVARGGQSTLDNLRLLCAHHNRLEAERLMGCSGPPGTSAVSW